MMYSLCCKCGDKISHKQKYCDKCKSKAEAEREQIQKVKSKKYNSDRYKRDLENESYRLFYLSKAWKSKRREILRRDNFECQICKALFNYKAATDVHHILNLRDHYEKRLDSNNLISLCNECHTLVHSLKLNNIDKIEDYINQKIKDDKFIQNLYKLENQKV